MAKREVEEAFDVQASDLESLVGYNLKRAYIVVQDDFRGALGSEGPSARVFSALSLCVNFPNITQSELARMMGIERSGLVAIVDELEEQQHLKRVPVPGDRRVQALVPTEKGKTAYSKAVAAVRDHEDRLFEEFTPDEKATLLKLLKKIRGDKRS